MAYLNDLWIPDPNKARLFKIVNDEVTNPYSVTEVTPRGILVDLNMVDVWTANSAANSISQFNNGKRIADIKVGKIPMSIAQHPKTLALYVTCFGSNDLYKIVNGKVVLRIPVGIGPRGITILPNGDIYVSNYISSTVTKIVDDVVVKNDIKVGLNPYGICHDKFNNVWTANSGSNTASKITNTTKVLDVEVGKCPQGICSDKAGNVYTSNFLSDNVSKIESGKFKLNIPVGKGPFAITPTEDGYIYTANYLGASLSKIRDEKNILTITVCDNPCPFGDFSGYQNYLTSQASSGSGTGDNKKIAYADLDTALQTIINNASSGTVDSLVDSKVTHDDPMYSTVKIALDYLLYKDPDVTSFTNDINTVETGTVVSTVKLAWAVNKTIVSQTINNGVGVVPIGTTNKTLSSLNITSDISWAITIDDGKKTVSKSTGISFRNKRYWGTSSNTALTGVDILALNKEFAADYRMTKDLNASGGKYLYFVVPTSFGLDNSKFKIGGLANSDWVKTTLLFTNASGYTTSYDVFRSGNIQNGTAINVVVG